MDIPLQSLFFALINYRHTMEKYFYLPGAKEQVESNKEQFFSVDLLNYEFVHLQKVKSNYDGFDPDTHQSSFQKNLFASKGLTGSASEYAGLIRKEKLNSLIEILDFIKLNKDSRNFFDKNGNRDQYDKLKTDQALMRFHSTVHYFISYNIPVPIKKNRNGVVIQAQDGQPAKSCLKQKEFQTNITASNKQTEVNFFNVAKNVPKRQKNAKTISEKFDTIAPG